MVPQSSLMPGTAADPVLDAKNRLSAGLMLPLSASLFPE
jgi:hypothetical protein